ncbi:MAG TPA: aspartyl protease family protein [Pyrinomonadaceae bacterium]|jgi:predicted aspartyl protease
MSKILAVALSTLIAASALWAVPLVGTAHERFKAAIRDAEQPQTNSFITPVRLKPSNSRGLIATVWVNDSGPFQFALDTGAGVSLVSRDLVTKARLPVHQSNRAFVGGLSAGSIVSNQSTTVRSIAFGTPNNKLSTSFSAAVVASLPGQLDGILDPTEAFSPRGYSIDIPKGELRVIDFSERALQSADVRTDGALVKWVRQRNDHRPFVRLGDSRLALIDTGSNFGLAVSDGRVVGMNPNRQNRTMRDLSGGSISARRVAPTTVNIGSLVLRSVPTDVLFGAPAGTPVLLGRDALYPFRLTFDPANGLIGIEPSEQ